MRVLYLNPDRGIPILGTKGASVHVREFVAELVRQGHDVVLVCATLGEGNAPPPAQIVELPPSEDVADLEAEATALGLPRSVIDDRIQRRELGRLAYDRAFADRVRESLDECDFRPDVIYERHALFHRAGAALAGSLGVPRLLEVNAPLVQEQERFRGLGLKYVALDAERTSFFGADLIVAVSEEVAAYIAGAGTAADRILTLPNGVDTERFRPGIGREVIRTRYGFGEAPVIGFIGSFKPWHGVAFLIDAFSAIARSHPSVRLLCVGEGPELDQARRRVVADGLDDRVVFIGRVPYEAIPSHLAAMDVSVAPYLPSPNFYFSPLKVVESLAVGTPVIASRIGQLRHLVDDGKTGLLFSPGNTEELVAKTHELILDARSRHRMASEGRKRASAEFGWDRVVRRVTSEARRLLAAEAAA